MLRVRLKSTASPSESLAEGFAHVHILVPSYEDPLCSYYPTQGAVRSDGISFQHGSSACLQHGVMDGGQDRIKIGFGDQQGYLHLGGGYQP